MRQLAMTCGYGPASSYVPAESAHLPIFDAIFTRIGAADDLVSGQSTLVVEMMEANNAISHATKDSWFSSRNWDGERQLMTDGSGPVHHRIHYEHIGASTLFATHYHELTSLESSLEHLVNVHGKFWAMGRSPSSSQDRTRTSWQFYGIHVAKIAGLP